MPIRCPNCSQEVEYRPIRCPRCGYRTELAREYLWLYVAGGVFVLGGFVFGALSVFVVDTARDHWSRQLLGWYPLGPWALTVHWLAFLGQGIVWTLGGLGITRHRWGALGLLAATAVWNISWACREVLVAEPGESRSLSAPLLLVAELAVLLVSARLAVALARTPRRDVRKLQEPSV
ncbi:MAG: hypothetical protein O7J95_17090 [Planctomycetota bacterium]|nr:hypothetical protein [Planctomycetota bacterium]